MEAKGISPHGDSRDKLIKKLTLFEDLWQKLIHVKWNQESFLLTAQLTKDMVQTARKFGDDAVTELILHLERQVNGHVAAGQLPTGLDRDRLEALLGELHRTLAPAVEAATGRRDEAEPDTAAQVAEIMVIAAGDEALQLVLKLNDAGFQVRYGDSLAEISKLLAKAAPKALIVDTNFPEGPRAGIEMIAQLRAKVTLMAPVFFLAQHGDLASRLEAVRIGGAAYFTKPLDLSALLEKLNDIVFGRSIRGCRVLILDEIPADAQRIAQVLEVKGIITQVVTKPMQVLLALHRFQPDLILLSLDLQEIGAKEIAKVIRQHEIYSDLSMILLSTAADANRRLAMLDAGGDDVLLKSMPDDYLSLAVIHHLRRARTRRTRLTALSRKDKVSGLYNRQHFLSQLERALVSVEIGTHSIAVMLILLDNLRSIREATDVATADEVVEQAAGRLQVALAATYEVSRFGDAVFAVLIKDADIASLLTIARGALRSVEKDLYEIGKHRVQLHACIGIGSTAAESGERDYLTLVQHADLACSLAREAKDERIHIYNLKTDQKDKKDHHQLLLEEIRAAVEQERMGLVFQPIVSLRGDRSERYEVFLRMFDQAGQELLPETVFAAVRQHRLGTALDRWVIAQSIGLLRERQTLGRTTILFINISSATLLDNTLSAWLQKRLQQTQVHAKNLVFELAETTARQYPDELRKFLGNLKVLGCGFCLERFGRQADSIDFLKNLPADYVKLGSDLIRGLVDNVLRQQQLRDLVKSLEAQGIIVIASGIEDLSTLPLLWSCGINHLQGFFLQRPDKEMSYDFTGSVI